MVYGWKNYTGEDDLFVDTFDFNLPTASEMTDIRPSTYVTCLCNLFWWVGMVTDIDAKQGDVNVNFMHPPHGPCKMFNWPQSGDACYVLMKNILCVISAPTTSTGRSYKIPDVDYQNALSGLQL